MSVSRVPLVPSREYPVEVRLVEGADPVPHRVRPDRADAVSELERQIQRGRQTHLAGVEIAPPADARFRHVRRGRGGSETESTPVAQGSVPTRDRARVKRWRFPHMATTPETLPTPGSSGRAFRPCARTSPSSTSCATAPRRSTSRTATGAAATSRSTPRDGPTRSRPLVRSRRWGSPPSTRGRCGAPSTPRRSSPTSAGSPTCGSSTA